MTRTVITPHEHKRRRKQVREDLGALRRELAKIRALLMSASILEREDGYTRLDFAWHTHNVIRAELRYLRTVKVAKYAHVSPAAAARLRKGS